MNEYDIEVVKDAARAAAWDAGRECATCHEGKIRDGSNMTIHCSLNGFGADWSLDSVLEVIGRGEIVGWQRSIFGHDLHVLDNGKIYAFEVAVADLPAGGS